MLLRPQPHRSNNVLPPKTLDNPLSDFSTIILHRATGFYYSSIPPAPSPAFNPLPSHVRVNAFWSTTLVFGLLAAFLAILVLQWVRDYIRVFQRYSDPLKSARLRQYLREGSEGWYILLHAQAALHIPLF